MNTDDLIEVSKLLIGTNLLLKFVEIRKVKGEYKIVVKKNKPSKKNIELFKRTVDMLNELEKVQSGCGVNK